MAAEKKQSIIPDIDLEWACKKLINVSQSRFYGELTFLFVDGKIKKSTLKDDELPPSMRKNS